MQELLSFLKNTSMFRRVYIICLFCTLVLFVQIPAYVCFVLLFVWGLVLTIYNIIKYKTYLKMHFGLWLIVFLAFTIITMFINIKSNFWLNLVFECHIAICFFTFYGLHIEGKLNFRSELYSLCRFFVYTTTILGIIGLACLMAGISFQVGLFKFIIFDNRFTSVYSNPNHLGLVSCLGIFSTHMLTKQDFIKLSEKDRVSRIWLATSLAVNSISLILCDSNSSFVLLVGYCIFFIGYKLLGKERNFTLSQIIVKSIATLFLGVFVVVIALFVRGATQIGISNILEKADALQTTPVTQESENVIIDQNLRPTFTHENQNIDSGRYVLWEQGFKLFLDHPVFGIGKPNIYTYGEEKFENGIKFSRDFPEVLRPLSVDLHNGYLTILVCSGVLGFLAFFVFGLRFFIHITKHVLRESELSESVLPCMYSFLCAYLLYSIFEKTLIYDISLHVVYFWLILGYTACFLTKYEGDHKSSIYLFKQRFRKTIV